MLPKQANVGNAEGLTESGIPFIPYVNQLTQAQAVLANATNATEMNNPTIGTCLIKEFTHEGYLVQAFPTLYPEGRAGYLAPARPHKVGAVDYFSA